MRRLFDDELYNLASYLNPVFYKLNLTPNILTIISIIFGCLCLYNFHINNRIYACIFLFLRHFFDITDGNFARQYKMVSKFGDILDHLGDTIFTIGILVLFFLKNRITLLKITPLLLLINFISINHVSCKQNNFQKNNKSNMLSLINNCVNKNIVFLFNVSTMHILICIIILYYK